MPDAYVIETVRETDQQFGDSLSSDLHGGMTVVHTLQYSPRPRYPAFFIIQTNEVVDSRDDPVKIVNAPSEGADWVLIGHLTRGARTHIVEIGAPERVNEFETVPVRI